MEIAPSGYRKALRGIDPRRHMLLRQINKILLYELKDGIKMEQLVEQIVKRKKGPKDALIRIITILGYILIPLICIALGYIINFYFIIIAFFILMGGIYIIWYVFSSLKVEYEYTIISGSATVSKIIDKRKRKGIVKFEVSKIEELIEYDNRDFDSRLYSHIYDATGRSDSDKTYAATITTEKYGRCVLLFTPNQRFLDAMRPYLSRQIVID